MKQGLRIWWMLIGFIAALGLRLLIGGHGVKTSAVAGLVFGAALLGLSLAAGFKLKVSPKIVGLGLLGGAALCLPVLLKVGVYGAHRPTGNYLYWLLVVVFVATAEELFLRGSLYDLLSKKWNQSVAIVAGACLFALLHLPLYGLSSVPLDFAVGCWLGALRATAKSVVAPAIAHVVADAAGWWLV